MNSLQTRRLRIRPLTTDDAAFILELVNDPEWLRYIGDKNVHDLEAAQRYLQNGPIASYERHGHGLYCVESLADGQPLGLCGLLRRDTLPDPDIGFALLPAYRGCGYIVEAARAVMEQGWREHAMRRIAAITLPDNQASIAVLQKLGMQLQGRIQLGDDHATLLHFLHERDQDRSSA